MNLRTEPHAAANEQSTRVKADRMRHRPVGVRALIRWLTREYELEAPGKLHSGATIEEDGDPTMTGEAKGWLGFAYPPASRDQSQPTDWVGVACRLDEDGDYVTPLRCAIARISNAERRNLVGELAVNLLYPRDVTAAHGIPDWCANDVVEKSLDLLWALYRDKPLPKRPRPSESQSIAEAGEAA